MLGYKFLSNFCGCPQGSQYTHLNLNNLLRIVIFLSKWNVETRAQLGIFTFPLCVVVVVGTITSIYTENHEDPLSDESLDLQTDEPWGGDL